MLEIRNEAFREINVRKSVKEFGYFVTISESGETSSGNETWFYIPTTTTYELFNLVSEAFFGIYSPLKRSFVGKVRNETFREINFRKLIKELGYVLAISESGETSSGSETWFYIPVTTTHEFFDLIPKVFFGIHNSLKGSFFLVSKVWNGALELLFALVFL